MAIYDPRAYNLTVLDTTLVSKTHFTKTIEGRKERKRKAWPEKPKTNGGGGGGTRKKWLYKIWEGYLSE